MEHAGLILPLTDVSTFCFSGALLCDRASAQVLLRSRKRTFEKESIMDKILIEAIKFLLTEQLSAFHPHVSAAAKGHLEAIAAAEVPATAPAAASEATATTAKSK
jgi:hypothetical protein